MREEDEEVVVAVLMGILISCLGLRRGEFMGGRR